jgi:hypothetical protein
MRISRYWSLLVAISISPTFCFPSLHRIPRHTPSKDDESLLGLRETIVQIQAQASNGTLLVQQRDVTEPVDVSGAHAFAAPDFDAGDQRGPCPGLNALANHGYIAHTGITTFTELLTAVHEGEFGKKYIHTDSLPPAW